MRISIRQYFWIVPAILTASVPAHAVTSNPTAALTWDGQFLFNPPSATYGHVPGTWAKLHFDVRSGCSGYEGNSEDWSSDITTWPDQLDPLYAENVQCSGSLCNGHLASATGGNQAFISNDALVRPGGAYLFSGRSMCGQPGAYDSQHYYSQVVNVPPVFEGITITSTKTYDNFDRLKVGENLRISVTQNTPDNTAGDYQIPLRKTLIVEGAGIAKREYDLSSFAYGMIDVDDITPTTTGKLALTLRVEGYVYYEDHTHNTQYDWSDYEWGTKTRGNPALYTDTVFYSNDELSEEDGLPKYHAEPFRVESSVFEIPVDNGWCVIPNRSDPVDLRYANPEEACAACSSSYQAYYDVYGDFNKLDQWLDKSPCGSSSGDGGGSSINSPGGSSGSSGGCSAAGSAVPLSWVLLALLPALRRTRAKML